jgi:phenylalanyl-tRNA synthetase beta chain
MIGICISGTAHALSWHEKQRNVDIFDLKGLVLSLLNGIGLDNSNLIYYNAPSSLTEMTIGVEINGTYVGSIGKCPSNLLKKFKIEQDVYFAELDVEAIVAFDTAKKYKPFSKFPTVVRDVAFIVGKETPVGDIEHVIRTIGSSTITAVTLFDLFEGKTLGEGKKSIAFSISLNSIDKTLTEAEIDSVVSSVTGAVIKKFGATLRSM